MLDSNKYFTRATEKQKQKVPELKNELMAVRVMESVSKDKLLSL